MKASQKKIRKLITEAVIKYANGTKAVNATGIFSKESLESQFQKFYEEGRDYQASIITNPSGGYNDFIDEMGQASAASKLYKYIESLLAAKYGPAARIIFNLSDFPKGEEQSIVDFPSLEKAVKRATSYNIEQILYSGNMIDFPSISPVPSDTPRSKNPSTIEISPIDDETQGFDITGMMFSDNDDTVPRDEYEPTQPHRPFYEPTGVALKK